MGHDHALVFLYGRLTKRIATRHANANQMHYLAPHKRFRASRNRPQAWVQTGRNASHADQSQLHCRRMLLSCWA